MKKIVLSLALVILCSINMFAQSSFKHLAHKYSDCHGAEVVDMGPIMFSLCKSFIDDDDEDAAFVKGIKSMSVIDISCCSEDVKDAFRKDVERIDSEEMDLLMQAKDGADILKIFVKQNDNYISQFLLVNTGDEPCMVNIFGKISKDDVGRLVADNK